MVYVNIQMDLKHKLIEQNAELTQNRIAIMLSQIQPHFLYNSLSAISGLCSDDSEAQEALLKFSFYLRANMDSLLENRLIIFTKELEHVEHYLWLEKLRFDKNIRHNDGRSHTGISNVRGRLEAMCFGSLKIESKIGEGTTVIIEIPKGYVEYTQVN